MDIFKLLFKNHEDNLKKAANTKKKQAENLIDLSKERLNEAYDSFSKTVDEVYGQSKEKAKSVYIEGSKIILNAEDKVELFVKEKPVTSFIIAAGIGYLIFSLLKKNSDD